MAINLANVQQGTRHGNMYMSFLDRLDESDEQAANAITGLSLRYEIYPCYAHQNGFEILIYRVFRPSLGGSCEFSWSEVASDPIGVMETVDRWFWDYDNN